ncbi:hypothetical protein EV361DRAFT_586529 [Lentinula raphanica]|nr:hypothetical protein EV361DRAFT_586529 [Lentinula raphanica]
MSNPPQVTSDTDSRSKEPFSPWLGLSLGIATVVATLAIPSALYLRRSRTTKLPTRRIAPHRRTTGTPLRPLIPSQTKLASSNGIQQTSKFVHPSKTELVEDSNFNPALYTAGAFGIATLLVSSGAVLGVYAVKTMLGVHDTQEFSQKMRRFVLTRMPFLSSRIHRVVENGDDDDYLEDPTTWRWEDAEKRLKNAFDQNGFAAWAEVALKEMRAEERAERLKRKGLDQAHEGKATG